MRDVLGDQVQPYRRVLETSQRILEEQYNYKQALVNVVEPESLYVKTLGVTSDIVLKEMYEARTTSNNSD